MPKKKITNLMDYFSFISKKQWLDYFYFNDSFIQQAMDMIFYSYKNNVDQISPNQISYLYAKISLAIQKNISGNSDNYLSITEEDIVDYLSRRIEND